jgi:hypothetical protein
MQTVPCRKESSHQLLVEMLLVISHNTLALTTSLNTKQDFQYQMGLLYPSSVHPKGICCSTGEGRQQWLIGVSAYIFQLNVVKQLSVHTPSQSSPEVFVLQIMCF